MMARPPRAPDYADKSRFILDRSATLFAEYGYDRASINMIAARCGMSKALLYHYYSDKSQLLFDIIESHLGGLLKVTEPRAGAPHDPRQSLYGMAEALLDAYREADAYHKVQLNHMHLLPPDRAETLRGLERRLVDRFACAIQAALGEPGCGRMLLKPLTMSLFGMLNWNFTWFRDGGALTRNDYARLAVDLVIDGVLQVRPDRNRSPPARTSDAPGRPARSRARSPRVPTRS